MSARSYMSIGDVLTLLRQEFPDVTISKIRFLESQGLVNPERTPSGYRKFYDHDVERLRWVLRQQREHFLPLKVIKDRLDDGSAASAPDRVPTKMVRPASVETSAGHSEGGAVASRDEHRSPEPVLVGHRATADSATVRTERRGNDEHLETEPVIGATLPGIDGTSTRPAGAAGAGTRRLPGPAAGMASVSRDAANRPSAGGVAGAAAGVAGVAGVEARTGPGPSGESAHSAGAPRTADIPMASGAPATSSDSGSDAGPGRVHRVADPEVAVPAHVLVDASPAGELASEAGPTANDKGSGQRSAAGSSKPSSTPSSAPSTPISSSSTPVDLNGASLSLEELASACGLATAVLQELQSFGLLVPTLVAGVEYFDEESLAVANVAARFAQFGIEPRHLRLYKNAADREAGFIEQIVLPLVRQRNPEARVRAIETVDELTQLGQQLRGSLLRSDLRSLLNG